MAHLCTVAPGFIQAYGTGGNIEQETQVARKLWDKINGDDVADEIISKIA